MCHLETLTTLYWHWTPLHLCLLLLLLLKRLSWKCLLTMALGHWNCLTSWKKWKFGKFYSLFHSHTPLTPALTHSQWPMDVEIPKHRPFAGKTVKCPPELLCRSGWVCTFTQSHVFTWRSPAAPCFPTLPPPVVSSGIITFLNHLHSNPWPRLSS